MKVKIFPEHGETLEDAEDKLEKALKTKRESQEKQYARESYKDKHLDDFHDFVTSEHEAMVNSVLEDIEQLLRDKIRES